MDTQTELYEQDAAQAQHLSAPADPTPSSRTRRALDRLRPRRPGRLALRRLLAVAIMVGTVLAVWMFLTSDTAAPVIAALAPTYDSLVHTINDVTGTGSGDLLVKVGAFLIPNLGIIYLLLDLAE